MAAIFESDGNGDYQPTGLVGAVAVNFELDGNNDIMPRETPRIAAVPQGLAAADPVTDGDLTISISNAGAYALGERIDVYNDANDALLGNFDAASGSGKISGLTNDVLITVYARASGDTMEDSAKSSTTTGTPTSSVEGSGVGGASIFNSPFN